MEPFTFYLDWAISSQFAGLCWAKDKGLYARADLSVDLRPWAEDGRSNAEKVMSGGICAGCNEDNRVVNGIVRGQPVKAVATMLQESPLVVMTRPGSGILSLADLRGKRVAMRADGIQILEAVLALAGIDRTALEITIVAFDVDSLMFSRFDAVQAYAMTEPVMLATTGVEVDLIPVRHPRLRPYSQVIFASEQTMDLAPDAIRRFLGASFDGWRQAMAEPGEAARAVVRVSGGKRDLATQRQVLEALRPFIAGQVGLERFGIMNASRWAANLESYARFGITPRQLDVGEVVDETFLREIYPIGGQEANPSDLGADCLS
jgi:ABC-type nitrate/sulfonate/bicarbonate transport system substrate-binding protein